MLAKMIVVESAMKVEDDRQDQVLQEVKIQDRRNPVILNHKFIMTTDK